MVELELLIDDVSLVGQFTSKSMASLIGLYRFVTLCLMLGSFWSIRLTGQLSESLGPSNPWTSRVQHPISDRSRLELSYISYFLHETRRERAFTAPLSFLVPRSPTFECMGDACKAACAGYSRELNSHWMMNFEPRAQEVFDDLSINVYEFTVILVNFILADIVVKHRNLDNQVGLFWTDSMPSKAWAGLSAQPSQNCAFLALIMGFVSVGSSIHTRTAHID